MSVQVSTDISSIEFLNSRSIQELLSAGSAKVEIMAQLEGDTDLSYYEVFSVQQEVTDGTRSRILSSGFGQVSSSGTVNGAIQSWRRASRHLISQYSRGITMEAQYKTRDGRLLVKVDADSPEDLFKRVAAVQKVFEAESECGCCHSTDIRFRVRTIEENDFYELLCRNCGARFEFGQNKKGGGLFPKRRNDAGPLPNRGWAKYEPIAIAAGTAHLPPPCRTRAAI